MSAALDAHISLMARARETHDLRTVHGHAYPVSLAEMTQWEEAERAARRNQARAILRSVEPLYNARKAFR